MSQSLSVSEIIRTGKMDVDFEVRDNYVTGLCVLYAERTAKEQEYMIREKSIVMLEKRNLSGCVQEAKDLACQSALRHLSDISALTGAASRQKPVDYDGILPSKVEKPILHELEPELKKPAEEEPLPIPEEPVEAADTVIPTEEPDDTLEPEEEEEPVLTGATQVGFGDLRPASSLLKPEPQPAAEPDPDEDEAYERLKKKCGLPNVVFHSLRHSSTTYKLKLNHGDVKATQGDTGHAQPDVVTEVYAHILDEDRKINAQKFEMAFYANPDMRKVEASIQKEQPSAPTLDLALLVQQLQEHPEQATTLAGLLKNIG